MNYSNVKNRKIFDHIKHLENEVSSLKEKLIEKELKIMDLMRDLEKASENVRPRKQA